MASVPTYEDYQQRARILLSNRALVGGIIATAFAWAVWGTGFGIVTLVEGFAKAATFVATDLLPPRLDVAPQYIGAALETLYMSYVGMVISVILSIPLGVLAARNITVNRGVAYFAKATTGFIRAVPEIVFAMFLVGVFGLGPLAGTIALGVGGVGILAKNYADSFEKIDMGQLEGLRAAGASWLQILGQGVWPQFKPSFVSWSLFRLDLNIRSAAVLGLVGAGGIGHSLNQAINLYQFKSATTIILMIFVMILAVEALTGALRRRLL
jgi:phosphonate transport system permease protein